MKAGNILEKVRAEQPLVHHITNWVTIGDCADVVKALGASPVMAHAAEEAAEMTARHAGALVLNIGTLTKGLVAAMVKAGRAANIKGIPVVLDVCGAGATALRNRQSGILIRKVKMAVIKGNASEIAAVAGEGAVTRGVDAVAVAGDLPSLAAALAKKTGATVVVTGKEDIVAGADGALFIVKNGCELMGRVVGTGCMAASVIGAFAAVEKDTARAAAAALACYEAAAEKAAKKAKGPGSFKPALMDEVSALTAREADRRARIS